MKSFGSKLIHLGLCVTLLAQISNAAQLADCSQAHFCLTNRPLAVNCFKTNALNAAELNVLSPLQQSHLKAHIDELLGILYSEKFQASWAHMGVVVPINLGLISFDQAISAIRAVVSDLPNAPPLFWLGVVTSIGFTYWLFNNPIEQFYRLTDRYKLPRATRNLIYKFGPYKFWSIVQNSGDHAATVLSEIVPSMKKLIRMHGIEPVVEIVSNGGYEALRYAHRLLQRKTNGLRPFDDLKHLGSTISWIARRASQQRAQIFDEWLPLYDTLITDISSLDKYGDALGNVAQRYGLHADAVIRVIHALGKDIRSRGHLDAPELLSRLAEIKKSLPDLSYKVEDSYVHDPDVALKSALSKAVPALTELVQKEAREREAAERWEHERMISFIEQYVPKDIISQQGIEPFVKIYRQSGSDAQKVFQLGIPVVLPILRQSGFSNKALLTAELRSAIANLKAPYQVEEEGPIADYGDTSPYSGWPSIIYSMKDDDAEPRRAMGELLRILEKGKFSVKPRSKPESPADNQLTLGFGVSSFLFSHVAPALRDIGIAIPAGAEIFFWVAGLLATAYGIYYNRHRLRFISPGVISRFSAAA